MPILARHQESAVLGAGDDAGKVLQRDAVIVVDDTAVRELDLLALNCKPRIEAIHRRRSKHLPRLVPAHRCWRYHSRERRRPSRMATCGLKPNTRFAFIRHRWRGVHSA